MTQSPPIRTAVTGLILIRPPGFVKSGRERRGRSVQPLDHPCDSCCAALHDPLSFSASHPRLGMDRRRCYNGPYADGPLAEDLASGSTRLLACRRDGLLL